MTDDKYRSAEPASLEGRLFRPSTTAELAEAIEAAFDYRGDVTLELKDGLMVAGYIFNRQSGGPSAMVELFEEGAAVPREIPYSSIVAIAFTGDDTASGKTWETWIAKKASQRQAETERVIADARARGHL
jgi:hypothetical protein